MSYPADLRYTKEHEWVRLDGNVAEVGVTDYAQAQLGDVVYVELPEVGRAITAGRPFGSIESVKSVSELFAPVSGEVIEVNTDLAREPEAVNKTPHETWMIKIRVSDPEAAASLLDHGQYEALIQP
jgi:glycine cleavage system H protein